MRAFRVLSAVKWKYAVGEVVLIVVGVSLALIANSQYESWRERQQEIRTLGQIEAALESDLDFLQGQVAVLRENVGQLDDLLMALRAEEVIGTNMRHHLAAVHIWRGIRMRSGPYEELKNRGLSLISEDSLRQKLVDLYESSYQGLQGSTTNDEIFSRDLALPYFYANFRQLADGLWEPIDGYAALDSDLYFENLVAAKLGRLQEFVLPNYDAFLSLTEQVLVEVRDELSSD